MNEYDDEQWLEGVRRLYFGGQPPPSYEDASDAIAESTAHPYDAYAAPIEAACQRAARERQAQRPST